MTVGIMEKTTRRIIADLETDGYIAKKEKGGASDTGSIMTCPRAETRQGKAVGDLLEILGWKRRRSQSRKASEN